MGNAFEITENLYQLIFKSASYGIIISDLEKGKVLVANPIAAEMHGFNLRFSVSSCLRCFNSWISIPQYLDFHL